MWHEARRQEKKIRGLIVDYRRRAERRRDFYEKIKLDPSHFLRLYGGSCKIHMDSAITAAADGPNSMMSWQGSPDVKIDRFDVRASLDYIPVANEKNSIKTYEEIEEERKCCYESYRVLVQNECAGVTEEQCLQQIYNDEQFGPPELKDDKKKKSENKAAIGYSYDGTTNVPDEEDTKEEEEDLDDSLLSDDEVDLDLAFDVTYLTDDQIDALNLCANEFGMKGNDYTSFLHVDKDEAEELKLAKLLEEEKAQFSGRKSRRERRAYKEKRLAGRPISPPSYAARESPKYEPYKRESSSSSRSRSPEIRKPMQFITSFGGGSSEEDSKPDTGTPLPQHVKKSQLKSKPRIRKSNSPRSKFKSPSYNKSYRRRSSSSTSSSRSRSRNRFSRRKRSSSSSRSRSSDKRRFSRSKNGSSSSRRFDPKKSISISSRSKSRSNSKSPFENPNKIPINSTDTGSAPQKKRYRRKSLSSNSSDNGEDSKESYSNIRGTPKLTINDTSSNSKSSSASTKLSNFQGRLNKRMMKALNKQYKADKKARIQKNAKAEQERIDREEELRTLSIQIRKREREKRHKELEELGQLDSSSDNDRLSDHSYKRYKSRRKSSDSSSSDKRYKSRRKSSESSSSDRNHKKDKSKYSDREKKKIKPLMDKTDLKSRSSRDYHSRNERSHHEEEPPWQKNKEKYKDRSPEKSSHSSRRYSDEPTDRKRNESGGYRNSSHSSRHEDSRNSHSDRRSSAHSDRRSRERNIDKTKDSSHIPKLVDY